MTYRENTVFSSTLRRLLRAHKLREADLGSALHINRRMISAYVVGSAEPSFSTLLKIAQYFGVTTDFLLTAGAQTNLSYIKDKFTGTFSPEEVAVSINDLFDEIDRFCKKQECDKDCISCYRRWLQEERK